MKIKLVLSNGNIYIVEAGNQEEFINKFTDEGGKIIKDILLIKDGLYINPKDIIEIIAGEENIKTPSPKNKKYKVPVGLKVWMTVNYIFLALGFLGTKTKDSLILLLPLAGVSLLFNAIILAISQVKFAKNKRNNKDN